MDSVALGQSSVESGVPKLLAFTRIHVSDSVEAIQWLWDIRIMNFRYSPSILPAAAVLLLLMAAPISAQTFSASLTGVVTDPNAAVIPAAEVTLTNVATQDTRETSTGAEGRYNFSSLLPGVYELRTVGSVYSGG